ncbi:unnamed protein product [Rodentolepis nana]|uniref:RNA polymerase III subunit C6 n=1 Tax=Rodentolepis nana TaxID=102285 RepID=A0A0R3TV66_RODNA|nr:unnamed protein product [Rodentolepis nana]
MKDTKVGINLLKLPDKIMAIIVANTEPVTQKHFEEQLPDVPVTELLPVLNTMQKKGQLEVLVNADRTLSWQLRTIKNIEKIKSLTDLDEKLVYNCIRKNANDGATVRTIAVDTKIQQTKLPKILKSLIARKMIKELPVMAGNKQKIYLLYELEPSRTLAANTLFAGESGVDVEFVSMLRTACLKYIGDKANTASKITDPFKRRNASYVTVEEIHNFIISTKLCTVPLLPADIKIVLDALYFGGELERKQSAVATTVMEAIAEKGDDCEDDDHDDTEVQPKRMRIDDVRNCKYRLAPKASEFACLARIPCIFALNKKRSRAADMICPPDDPIYKAFLETVGPSSSSVHIAEK